MQKNLAFKSLLIVVLVAVALWTLYPPDKTLKPGIDLAGGVSLIYEIDATGLDHDEKRDLSEKMITVLRRRIDPANIQNLIWRPQGPTRFEIQMPLASAEARQKRQAFEDAMNRVLQANVKPALVMAALRKPAEQQQQDFEEFAKGLELRLESLNELAAAYDELQAKNTQSDKLRRELDVVENMMSVAGLDADAVKANVGYWITLDADNRTETLKEFIGESQNLSMLEQYVDEYSNWAEMTNELTQPETGLRDRFDKAREAIDNFNLTEEQLAFILELPEKSAARADEINQLRTEFPDRADNIQQLVAAYEQYRPFRGRLDDPSDLKRMLKGAGILEFRILPTPDHADLTPTEIEGYVEALKGKGPKYASDNKYVWCEIEKPEEWKVTAIIGQFGEKYYVLASNKKDEAMLHTGEARDWKLDRARMSQDRLGRLAIGFTLDDKAGQLFARITGKNVDRPLCILLDGLAISAPNIQERIRREGIITGSFSKTEVEDMIDKLNAGSLPAMLIEQPILEKTIGPSIGADNRDRGIQAGLIGLIVVLVCMAFYYLLAGAIADLALFMNLLFVLGTMAFLRATFTLPGLAGVILTIGMSVDANVLIFERIWEEQKKGSSLRIAIRNGYQRAFRTILDANLTTFITAAILYWRASEEIKGFAIVLMIGIVSSMFTALFATRVIFDILLSRRIIKEQLVMLHLIGKPNVNWMALRPVFLFISVVLVAGGLFVFFNRDDTKNSKYDIEFTGGTSVQINLKKGVELSRQQVQDIIQQAGRDMDNPALAAANVYSIGKTGAQYEINTTETNKTTTTLTFAQEADRTVEILTTAIRKAEAKAGGALSNLRITPISNPQSFQVTTSRVNRSLVKSILQTAFPDAEVSEPQVDEVVNQAILTAFAGKLQIQQDLEPNIVSADKITEELTKANPQLTEFLGGAKITCTINKLATISNIRQRFVDLHFKPDVRSLSWYQYQILAPDMSDADPNQTIGSFVYVSAEPDAAIRELTEEEWTTFVENEKRKVTGAAELETSLPRVTQIDPSVGAEARTRALIAIALSLFAIVAYIWVRFGNVRYGLAAIAALVHDVCITLGAVTACTYLATTAIGEMLLIGDFKINLAVIAAFLTLIGYSLNDTIVVFDRIRENRKKNILTRQIITDSINQTISRTMLTSVTTFLVVLIMYIFGGPNLRDFTFAIGFGVIVGTYSSIAVAAPILLLGAKAQTRK
jgi:SecD/SecF fusion protein